MWPERSRLEEAIGFLDDELWGGWAVPVRKLEDRASWFGVGRRTLRRAKRQMGVISEKKDWDSGWTWRLPRDPLG